MQKKTIALAVAAGLISGAAFAQSNVTLYGVIDSYYLYSKSDYRKFSGIDDGGNAGSRIGVKGEENLGNGLKANFDMQWAAKGHDNGNLGGQRWAWVGLSSDFGSVRAGRVRQLSDEWSGATSSNGIAEIYPVNQLRYKLGSVDGSAGRVLNGSRWDNAVGYYSPNFSGLNFAAVYSFGEQVKTNKGDKQDTADNGKIALGARYLNGPVTLMAIYEAVADNAYDKNTNADGFGTKGWQVGGAYDFKVVKVFANYAQAKANHGGLAKSGTSVGTDKQSLWSVGLSAPVSNAGSVIFEYAQYKDYFGGLIGNEYVTRDVTYSSNIGAPGSKIKGYGLGYRHSLSKRTMLYTSVSRFDSDKGLVGGVGRTRTDGEDQSNFQVGIVHNF
jgi:predicted porin